MSSDGSSGGADAQEVESRVSVLVGVTVRSWHRRRFHRGILWEKLTKLNLN